MKFFVTGTSTDVGKTVIASWLCVQLKAAYYKPIQTGVQDGTDSDFVSSVARARVYPEAYSFDPPVSPHLAAQKAGKRIDLNTLVLPDEDSLIVEGAGGVLVPVNESQTVADVMEGFGLPVLVVSQSYLGTINHTLLTLEFLKKRELPIAGVIMNGAYEQPNYDAIQHYSGVPILAQVPFWEKITYDVLKKHVLGEKFNEYLRNR